MKTGWEIKKIKDICDKASSNIAMNKITDIDGIYPVYGASGFVQNVDFFHRDTPYIGIVKDGAGVGRVNVYPAYSSLLGTLQYILPKEGNSINYVAYALKSLNLASSVTGATIPHIYFKDYGEITLPVPPLPEQERIVSELDLISGVIEKKKEQLKELDSLAQSVFYEMFGNPVENEKGWEVKKFNECYKLTSGRSLTAKNIINGDYPVYGGNGIVGYHRDYNLDGDNIIIGRVGALCGNVRNVLGKSFITDNAFILTKNIDENNVFILYLLTIHDLRQYARDALQPVVSNSGFKNIDIIIPPLSLQQEFASKIEKIEKQKELIKQSLQDTETLFNSRMDYYFN